MTILAVIVFGMVFNLLCYYYLPQFQASLSHTFLVYSLCFGLQDTYVVCVLFKKDGPGPRNGAQYGAPFREEDWSDEEGRTDVPDSNNPANLHGPIKENSLVVTASHDSTKDCFVGMMSESCVSDVQLTASSSRLPPPIDEVNTPLSAAPLLDSNVTAIQAETLQTPAPSTNDDDLYSMLDLFVDEDEYLRFCGPNNNEVGVLHTSSLA